MHIQKYRFQFFQMSNLKCTYQAVVSFLPFLPSHLIQPSYCYISLFTLILPQIFFALFTCQAWIFCPFFNVKPYFPLMSLQRRFSNRWYMGRTYACASIPKNVLIQLIKKAARCYMASLWPVYLSIRKNLASVRTIATSIVRLSDKA